VESRRLLASDRGNWDVAGPGSAQRKWVAKRSSQPLGTSWGQEMRVGDIPRPLTEARETSYEIFSPLLPAECSTVELPGNL
jgi:hypothetical protein